MKPMNSVAWATLALAVAAQANLAQAREETAPRSAADAEASQIDTLVVTGTRRVDRTAFESTAPIDVVTQDALNSIVSDEIMDKLAATTPSFNVQRLPAADGQAFVRPATLRGLSPDQTLVLVNGKRRHRSAVLGAGGSRASTWPAWEPAASAASRCCATAPRPSTARTPSPG